MSQFKEELIIVRHARSLHNIRESEDLDCSLSDYGFMQAKKVGHFMSAHMSNVGTFRYFTSPFLRCLQTMHELTSQINPTYPATVLPSLREYINHSGREVEIPRRSGVFLDMNWSSYQTQTFKDEFNEQILNRIYDAYEELPPRSVVVTHGIPAMILLQAATGREHSIPVWDHSIDNASITRIINGRIIWRGRNLHHEVDGDVYAKKHSVFDGADMIK